MGKVVFILGAGASKEAGAPLMGEFLDVAAQMLATGAVEPVASAFTNVFRGISALQVVHSKSQLDLVNIEAIFSAFEMARTLERFPGRDASEIEKLVSDLKTLIVWTLQNSFGVRHRENRLHGPDIYSRFADLVLHLRDRSPLRKDVGVITFNYDLGLDLGLGFAGLKPNYHLDSNDGQGIPLLKLHGSLNWGACAKCGQIVPIGLADVLNRNSLLRMSTEEFFLNPSGEFQRHTHCGVQLSQEPAIVPPTWNKEDYHRSIAAVWRRAAGELAAAEDIFVIGYSLPRTDEFFRYLFALGSAGDSLLRRFWVINPDASGSVNDRFQTLLGPGAIARYQYLQMNFSQAIGVIQNLYRTSEG